VFPHHKQNTRSIGACQPNIRVLPRFFSGCRVFSAGMKIVIDKNLENTVWQYVFEGFLTRFYELYMHI
jgi:hypothetical protein